MEAADVGELGVERVHDLLRLVTGKVEGAGGGKDDAFLMEAQMYRVGA